MRNTEIYLIRHGKVDGPAALYGRTDVSLSEKGWQQLAETASQIERPDILITSPLKRCSDFAGYYANKCDLSVQVQSEFAECDFGSWDGVAFDQLQQDWQALELFWQSPSTNTPPNGEALADFHRRVITGWHALLPDIQQKTSWILCHGGVIRQLLCHLLGLDFSNSKLYSVLDIAYASVTKIEIPAYSGAEPRVCFIGRCC